MPSVTLGQRTTKVGENETVLDALLRDDQSVPHSCKSGSCQSCLVQATRGTPPKSSQVGLRDSLVAQNYFLACVAKADCDLEVRLPDSEAVATAARVAEIKPLSQDVARVLLEVEDEFEFRAGQFLNLIRGDGLVRSYSIANLHGQDSHLELHVRRVPNGQMSCWLFDREALGSAVHIRGPAGDCFYLPENPDQDLLLVGTGTGLAPLQGIIRDALRHGHRGNIVLYHGALNQSGLYLTDELSALAAEHEQFEYFTCVLHEDEPNGHLVGSLDEVVLSRHPQLKDWRVYLCGAPAFVLPMRKKVFLAGAHSKQIHADAFLTAASKS